MLVVVYSLLVNWYASELLTNVSDTSEQEISECHWHSLKTPKRVLKCHWHPLQLATRSLDVSKTKYEIRT